MGKKDNPFRVFFKYLIIGFLISDLRVYVAELSPLEIINSLFMSFMFHLIAGIPFAVSAVFGDHIGKSLFSYLKKNFKK